MLQLEVPHPLLVQLRTQSLRRFRDSDSGYNALDCSLYYVDMVLWSRCFFILS